MTDAAQPLTEDDGPLSPWWIRAILIVMVIGFSGLITISMLSYRNAPPIPAQVVDAQGAALFSADDVGEGQAVFLKYGLMDNGSIWGHGAYLGPDYSAAALHRMGEDTAEAIAQQLYRRPLTGLTRSEQAAVHAETTVALKTNRYDAATGALQFMAPQTAAFRQQINYWTDYFSRTVAQWRPEARPHHRRDRTASVHRLRHVGGVGVGGGTSRRRLFVHQ